MNKDLAVISGCILLIGIILFWGSGFSKNTAMQLNGLYITVVSVISLVISFLLPQGITEKIRRLRRKA